MARWVRKTRITAKGNVIDTEATVVRLICTVATTTAVIVWDADTVGEETAANEVWRSTATGMIVGAVQELEIPCADGIRVDPATGVVLVVYSNSPAV